MTNLIVGIVTYNPDIQRLTQNIDAIRLQVEYIIVVDNGSSNIEQIQDIIANRSHIILERFKNNEGIAKALHTIMDYAIKRKFDWVLTLDQDSVAVQGLIKNYLMYVDDDSIGALTCNIIDRNINEVNNQTSNCLLDVNECISSGCLMRTAAYQKTLGYDDELFIDYVDFDICYKLKEAGYRIVQIPYKGLLHEYGNGSVKVFLGKRLFITNHSPFRKYYMARNYLVMRNRYPQFISVHQAFINESLLIFKSLFYEDKKRESLHKIWKGIRDARSFIS